MLLTLLIMVLKKMSVNKFVLCIFRSQTFSPRAGMESVTDLPFFK